jgi:hypothetical protein
VWGAFAGVDYAEGYRLINIPQLEAKLGADREPA